ncbi:hypothetical protein VP01_36g8 [Puccinia sorghi]|uniref:Uncharacterized protein n=1 Tax=Puccinia sorghi TaxID=27349 RepID=A0A0L6UUB2_9BASI|nr:hypothetical protein VP01_36g8 [Puccinia sorghi]
MVLETRLVVSGLRGSGAVMLQVMEIVQMGYNIRQKMKNERLANHTYLDDVLLKKFCGDKYENMIEALSWNGSGTSPIFYWMTFPRHGYTRGQFPALDVECHNSCFSENHNMNTC